MKRLLLMLMLLIVSMSIPNVQAGSLVDMDSTSIDNTVQPEFMGVTIGEDSKSTLAVDTVYSGYEGYLVTQNKQGKVRLVQFRANNVLTGLQFALLKKFIEAQYNIKFKLTKKTTKTHTYTAHTDHIQYSFIIDPSKNFHLVWNCMFTIAAINPTPSAGNK